MILTCQHWVCLRNFLSEFAGCLLIVSHDRYFMDRLVDHLFVFEGDGVIKDFPETIPSIDCRWKKRVTEDKAQNTRPREQDASNQLPVQAGKQPVTRRLSYKDKREFRIYWKRNF
jgi:ATP-binding cassette subfamily F protein uup